MKFTDIRKIEHLLMEYGMKPGPSTPSSQQTIGSNAKSTAATKSPTTTKTAPKPDLGSPTTTPGLDIPKDDTTETPKFINAKAGELKSDMEYFDKDGKSAGIVKSPIGKGSKPEAVVVQNPKTKKYSVIDNPDEEVFVANPEFKEGKLDKLSKSSSSNFHFKKNKLQKRIKKLTRKIKMTEQGEPIFEINFNSKEVAQGALNANILCGFEAETVWPNLGPGADEDDTDWLDDLPWHRVSDLIYDQEGSGEVERVEEGYREWLSEEIVYEFESEVTQELVNDRKEDEAYIDNFVSDQVNMDDVEEYKENKLERLEIDDMQDELEEYSEWDDDAWAREYVEEYEQDNFMEWLEEDIRDNGEAWDDAWQRAMDTYDFDDWVRREHSGSWYSLLGDYNIYLYNDEAMYGGVDAVASEVEDWASNNSQSNDVRPGGYHSGKGVDNTYWRVEDDSSIEGEGAKAEIISPVYDSPSSMLKEISSLFNFLKENNVETNSTTGMHVTMSFSGDVGELNKLKIALLLGDQYVLKQFGRNFNNYTRSQTTVLKDYVKNLQKNHKDDKSLGALEEMVGAGLSAGKFSSINFKDVKNEHGNQLIEFRIAGGDDYHNQEEKLMKAVIRYAAVMQAGHDKDAYRKDYIKALFKLVYSEDTISTDAEKKVQQLVDPDSIDNNVLKVFQSMSSKQNYTDSIEALSNAYMELADAMSAKNADPQQELPFEAEGDEKDWRRTMIEAQKYFVQAFAMLATDIASGKSRGKIGASQISTLRRAVKTFGFSVDQLWSEIQKTDIVKKFPGDHINKLEKIASGVNTLLKKQNAKAPQPKLTINVPAGHIVLLKTEKYDKIVHDIFADGPSNVDPNVTVSEEDFLVVLEKEYDEVRRARYELEINTRYIEQATDDVKRYAEELQDLKQKPDIDSAAQNYIDTVSARLERAQTNLADYQQDNMRYKKVVDEFVGKYKFAPATQRHGSEPLGTPYNILHASVRGDMSQQFSIKFEFQENKMNAFDKFDKLPVLEQLALLEKIDKKKIDEAWSKKIREAKANPMIMNRDGKEIVLTKSGDSMKPKFHLKINGKDHGTFDSEKAAMQHSARLKENKIFFVKVGDGRGSMTVKTKASNSREALKSVRDKHPKVRVSLDINQEQGQPAGALESVEEADVKLGVGEYLYNVVYKDGTSKKVVAKTPLGARRRVAPEDGKYKDPANPTRKELGIQRVEKVSMPNRRPDTSWTKKHSKKKSTKAPRRVASKGRNQDKYGPAAYDADKAAVRKKIDDLEFERELRALDAFETVEAEQDMSALLTAYGTPKKKKKKKTNEEAVNDFSRVEIINGLLADHFPVRDLKKQMLAYQAMPIPEMLDAFHDLRAQAGDDACARGIVRYFSKALPEEMQSQLKLNEWSSSRVKELIVEAKGLMGRVAGDQFKNGDNTLEFQNVEVYPQDSAQFEDVAERDSFIADIEQQLNSQIQWTNTPNNGSLAFGIVTLTDPTIDDKPTYWGRYFKQKRADMMGAWANNQVPAGWKLQKAGAMKLDIGIDPQHLIKSENVHKSVKEIMQTVSSNSQGHTIQQELLNGLQSIANQEHPVFEGQIKNLPALRDYFGEIMGPVALMSGMVGGQAEDARQDLMGGAEWATYGVFWPQAMNYALVDSVFIGPDGTEVGISSKGGKGAKASAKNIADAIDKAEPELVKAHAFTVKVIKIVQEFSAIEGPFRLAELLGILPKKLELEIMQYAKEGKTEYSGLSKAAKELFNYGTPKQDIPGFNVGYALLALLAKKCAGVVNKDPSFSDGCIAFLNQSSIVQLYCKMGKQGDNARVTGWKALYPPNFRGQLLLDGAKNYYSSRIGGKFAFEFKPD